MRILLTLLVLSGLSACAGMLLGSGSSSTGSTTGSRTPGEQTSPARQSSTDSNVSGALRQQFSADREISQFGVGIRAVGGRVTLTGTVGSYDIRDRIVDIARNTRGVVSVDSRLVVNTNR